MTEIHTINGMIEESLLVKTDGSLDNEHESTSWTEWRDDTGEIVRRDLHVRLKKTLQISGVLEKNNG